MGKCKTKVIQTNLGTFRRNQTYPENIQAHSGVFRTLCYPDIFKTVVYSEPLHIQNQKHMQNPGIFTTLVYSEPGYIQRWHIQNLRHIQNPVHIYDETLINFTAIIIFANYNYFHKACRVEINS